MADQHADWLRLLRPDGPFLTVSVLSDVMEQGLDVVPAETTARLRQAWLEVQAAPDLLRPAWVDLIFTELLRWPAGVLAADGRLPDELRSWGGDQARPDAVVYGPDPASGQAERLLVYRRRWDEPLTRATRDQPSMIEQAAMLCRRRGVPLALLTDGRFWVLVHAKPGGPTSTAIFDTDLWLEEPALLRAFASLLGASRLLPPPVQQDGIPSASLAGLFERTANAQTQVTDTLGDQVRQAVELLVGEFARLDRESGGALLATVPERQVYRATLTVMMRLVFLLYAEEQRLLPVLDPVYAAGYAVSSLYTQLDEAHQLHGDEIADRSPAAWPRLLALFTAVHRGCDHPDLRIPAYGGSLFDPATYPWLPALKVTDLVIHRILDALLLLKPKQRGRTPERLSYKGVGVEQIGHVYEGLLEYSCKKVDEPHVGLIGAQEPEIPLSLLEAEHAKDEESFAEWLKKVCGASQTQLRKALAYRPTTSEIGDLGSACDNNAELAARVRPFLGLLRRDLRGIPTVFPRGSVLFTQVGDRRATGTHYTPRPLAEEVVEHTLAPLVYSPGPADGAEHGVWQAKPWEELLKLKVVDPAMGSGAFLVSACRYLADRVLDAWERDGLPREVEAALGAEYDRDTLHLYALRLVAARCVYGVDRDDMAVELAKLSMWLVTLAKDKPFGFLDHALRCGDSLVGLISESQVVAFHLDPERGRTLNNRLAGEIDELASSILTEATELRERIEATTVNDPREAEEKATLLARADGLTARLRLAADAVAGAALSTAGKSEDAFDTRLTSIADEVIAALHGDTTKETAARTTIDSWLKGPSRPEPIRPLHWPLEFPEVMRRGGFDAVMGNPPFIGGKRISGALGSDLREYLKQRIANDKAGHADLCSYFLLRNHTVAPKGRVGIIATNTIAQGDTREVGLDQLQEKGWSVYRAVKSQPWAGTASLEVSLLWSGQPGKKEPRILDGVEVSGITPSLDQRSRLSGNPRHLYFNANQSFQGCIVLGMGFILSPTEARSLVEHDHRNTKVLFPYLNGEDLNSRPDHSASRWVIDFNDMTEKEAQRYPDCFAIIESKVKPERQRTKPDGNFALRKPLPQRYWQYADKRPALREAIKDLNRVLAIARVSKTAMASFVPTGQVLNDKIVVFATDQAAHLALIDSAIHVEWAWRHSGTLKADLQYAPSDCFETFPQPKLTEHMEKCGEELHTVRSASMTAQQLGLTALYNLVNNPSVQGPEIKRIRELHVEIDESVREAYMLDEEYEPLIREYEAQKASSPLPTWSEIDLAHGFYDHGQGVRWTISPQARLDVLDKLLALNFYRYKQEEKAGLHAGRKSAKGKLVKPATLQVAPAGMTATDSFDGALFQPPDTLF
ncbi:Eco57I restriction-modification methylase domain-containing protein [Sphaerisporangium rhizosphaerae]|uniref:site-specific DNA-methyltransferase (adenine-specific) n=1 Tax=Sphaerisporangium rhizosphaerae TaxID=2269375 RepID=A0ABW2PE95_9ACTN